MYNERGLNILDASIMLDLCSILKINVNDLLSGQIIEIKNYQSSAETNLIELKKQIDKMRKTFSIISYVFGVITILMFIENIILNSIYRDNWDNSLYGALGLIISFIACIFWFGASILNFKINNKLQFIKQIEFQKKLNPFTK